MPVLLGARHGILAAFGASKADVVRRSLEGPETRSPAAHLVRAAHHLTIMLDDAAARDVSPTPRGAGHE
jgi:6-phosphogluconolactonase/glucosamine-6-phosphate isomerase/deaminase